MVCEDWFRVAQDIHAAYDDWDAFVVLHGTDTMAFSGAALSFMLSNINKTIILTGSQIPISRPRSHLPRAHSPPVPTQPVLHPTCPPVPLLNTAND